METEEDLWKKKYFWDEEGEQEKFESLKAYFDMSLRPGLGTFSGENSWLVPFPLSSNEGSFYGDLYWLYLLNVGAYLGKRSREELEPIYYYDEGWTRLDENCKKITEKIAQERGLNSKQEDALIGLACKRALFLQNYLLKKRRIMRAMYRDGRNDKPFWMESNLNSFIKTMREGVLQYIGSGGGVWGEIPDVFLKGDRAKIYEGEKGKKKFASDIAYEVLKQSEKDLRDVQKDLVIYWEASKQWWEKRPVIILQVGLWIISVISSVITIYGQELSKGWDQWYWLGIPVVGGVMAILIFSPQIKELGERIQKWKVVQWWKKKCWERMSRREQEKGKKWVEQISRRMQEKERRRSKK